MSIQPVELSVPGGEDWFTRRAALLNDSTGEMLPLTFESFDAAYAFSDWCRFFDRRPHQATLAELHEWRELWALECIL